MIWNKTAFALGTILFLGVYGSVFAGGEDAAARCRSQLDWSQRNYPSILSGCKEWLASGSYPARVHYYLGRTLFQAGERESAIAEFEKGERAGDTLSGIARLFASDPFAAGDSLVFSEVTVASLEGLARQNPVARLLLGYQVSLESGGSTDRDATLDQLASLYRSVADDGQPVGAYLLGSVMLSDHSPDNDQDAVGLLYRAGEAGVGAAWEALVSLGELDEAPGAVEDTQYRWATPEDIVMRQD